MEEGILTVSISNFMVSLLFIFLSIPLKNRKIKMNNWYGFRVEKAFKSDENWYKINEFGASQLIIWGMVLFFISIFTSFIDEVSNGVIIFLACLPLIIIIVPIVKTLKYSKKL